MQRARGPRPAPVCYGASRPHTLLRSRPHGRDPRCHVSSSSRHTNRLSAKATGWAGIQSTCDRPRTLHSVPSVMHTPEKRPRFSAQGKRGKHQGGEQQLPQRLVFLNQFPRGRGEGPASARTAQSPPQAGLPESAVSIPAEAAHFRAGSTGRVFGGSAFHAARGGCRGPWDPQGVSTPLGTGSDSPQNLRGDDQLVVLEVFAELAQAVETDDFFPKLMTEKSEAGGGR